MRLDTSRIPVLLLLGGMLLTACGDSAPEAQAPAANATPATAVVETTEPAAPAGVAKQVPPPLPGDAPPPIAQTPDVAEEPAVKPEPSTSGQWKPYFDALPFELGPKRGLSKAKALGKPVFMFYAATW
jgi:hypothetical protein